MSAEIYVSDGARYVEVSKQYGAPSGQDKTAVSISLRDKPGALSRILNIFASASINLSLISSSRMAHEGLGAKPHFFVEFEGHISDPKVDRVLDSIGNEAQAVDFLGSYMKVL